MRTHYGAIVHGRRVDTDVASSVEASSIAGARVVALVAVQGDLATPSRESVKNAFARITEVGDGTARKLAAATPPPPYAAGVAVVLLLDGVAHVATTGGARCYRERDGTLAEVAAGAHEARSGDAFIAASHASLRAGQAFFTTAVAASDDAEFRNDTLDAALASALASYTSLVGLAAARIH